MTIEEIEKNDLEDKKPRPKRRSPADLIGINGVVALLVVAALLGAGIAAYNADYFYLSDKNSAAAYFPEKLVSGSESSFLVTLADNEGSPASGKEVSVFLERGGTRSVLWEGQSDESGTVRPVFQVPRGEYSADIVVVAGSEVLTRNITVVDTTKIIISTDKPIYQPGQDIHIRTLTYEGAIPQASQKNTTILIKDPEGNKIFRKVLTPNEFGVAALDYPLSDQLPHGAYEIQVTTADKTVNKSVAVLEYVLPKFRIDMDGLKSWYTVDEDISGTVDVEYFFGRKVAGTVSIQARVYMGVWSTVATRSGTLTEGLFPFYIDAVQYAVGVGINSDNGYLELNVSVTDTGGHTEAESHIITLSKQPIILSTLTDTNIVGVDSTVYTIARYPDGTPVVGANLTFTLSNVVYVDGSWQDDSWQDDWGMGDDVMMDAVRSEPAVRGTRAAGDEEILYATTDDRGIASITFKYDDQTLVTVNATKDGASVEENVRLGPAEGLKVVAEHSAYDVGDTASFNVYYNGASLSRWVYYDVVSEGFVITSGRASLLDGLATFTTPVTPDMSPMAEVRVFKVQEDLSVTSDSVALVVGTPKGLNVTITTDKELYRPAEDIELRFQVSGENGPVTAVIGVAAVDMSVFELSSRFSGLEKVFFSLEEEFITPQYQVINYIASPLAGNLPAMYLCEGECGSSVSKASVGFALQAETSGARNIAAAADVKEEAVSGYWTVILLAGIVGYLALLVVAVRYGKATPLLVGSMVLAVGSIGVVALYSFTGSLLTSDAGVNEQEGGGGILGGGDDAEIMGAPPQNEMDGDGVFDFARDDGALEATMAPNAVDKMEGEWDYASNDPVHVRKFFPETWYWNPTLITDQTGAATLNLQTPDSITTWGIEAIASTIDARLGMGTANVTVFQEFFVEPDIPVSVVRNDSFPLSILIYNYQETESMVTVTLDNASWFELHDPEVKTLSVAANSVASVTFNITAKDVGLHNVTLKASAGALADAVIRLMKVVPDGKQIEKIHNGQLENDQNVSVTLVKNSTAVPYSHNALVKIQGGMEAVMLDGAEGYIQFVSGCGEQSMSTLSVDILAYDTLQNMDGTIEKLFEYEIIVNQGIQHELNYLLKANNGKGRGIVWFPGDQDVHPWLTSWGLITFQDAIDAGFYLDEDIITDMQNWLVSQQEDDGSYKFPEWGIYETNNPILKSKKVATTAYITRALLYSGYDPDSDAVQKSLEYIESKYQENWDDPYTLSLALIALADGGGETSTISGIATRLSELAIVENGSASWTSEINMLSDSQPRFSMWGRPNSRTIETTGYAIMALNKARSHATLVQQGVKYLLENRDVLGGFFSTQDTVVAFQALKSVSSGIDVEEMEVKILANGALVETLTLTDENKDLTYRFDLRPYLENETEITLESEGSGTVLYQVYFEEYIPWALVTVDKPTELTLDVKYDASTIAVNDRLKATLTVAYNGESNALKMILVDLRAPVGFAFDSWDFEALQVAGTINLYEIKDRQMIVYIADIQQGETIEFDYHLTSLKPIRGVIQGITAFDMYDPELKVEVSPFEIESVV